MIRINNIESSLDFYCHKLGLIEISRYDSEKGRFTLIFLAAPDDVERARGQKAPMVEMTYNWDTEAYEKRAKERAKDADSTKKGKSTAAAAVPGEKRPMEEDDESNREEFIPADKGAAGPLKSQRAFLKARRNKVDMDSKIGFVEIVNPEAAATTKASVGEPGSSKVCNNPYLFQNWKGRRLVNLSYRFPSL